MHLEITRFDNGFRVASASVADVETVAYAITVGVGARYETLAQHGVSHLLEHMAFKGTPTHNARELAEAFDLMGGNINAYTGSETTVYYVKVLKEYAEEALALLCDIVRRSTIDAAELERERGVILQEIAMYNDTPDELVIDHFQACCFPDQPMGRSILGTEETIMHHGRDDITRFITEHYVPQRMVLSGAGAVDHGLMERVAKAAFADLPAYPLTTAEPGIYRGGRSIVHKDSLEQVQLVIGYDAVARTDPDYYALQVFSTLLGGGMSSRLFQEIREKRGLVYTVSSFVNAYNDCGVLGIYAATGAEQMDELMPALADVLRSADMRVSAQELLRAKNQIKAGIVMASESTGSTAEWIGRHLLIFDRVKPASEILAKVDAITLDDMHRIEQRFIGTSALTVATLGPITALDTSALPQA